MVCSRIDFQKSLDSTSADRLFYISHSRDEHSQHSSENTFENDVMRLSMACHYAGNHSCTLADNPYPDTNRTLHLPTTFLLQGQEGSAKYILHSTHYKHWKHYLDSVPVFPSNSHILAMRTTLRHLIKGCKCYNYGYHTTLLELNPIFCI